MLQARIRAHPQWNSTKIELSSGKQYTLTAQGLWIDFYVPCGPDGYWTLPVVKQKLRFPQSNLFTLIGSIGSDEGSLFAIGSRLTNFSPDKTGELTCFANDIPYMYWNNWGSITLEVSEI